MDTKSYGKSCKVGCQTVTRWDTGVILSNGRYIPFGKEDFDPYLTYLGEEYVGEVGERLEKIGVRIELFKEESSKFVLYPMRTVLPNCGEKEVS